VTLGCLILSKMNCSTHVVGTSASDITTCYTRAIPKSTSDWLVKINALA
jgi:hypothetical protein